MISEYRLEKYDFRLEHENTGMQARFRTSSEGAEIAKGEFFVLEAEFSFEKPTCPEKVQLNFSVPIGEIGGIWSQQAGLNRNLPPDWGKAHFAARSSSGIPLLSLISAGDKNLLTVYLQDCQTPCAVSAGYCEETNEAEIGVTFFAGLVQPLKSYKTRIYYDFSRRFFGDCVKEAIRRYEKEIPPAFVPPAAKDTVFSTWYCYHQNLNAERLIADCKEAKRLGIDTVIIDDGWQTSDSSRGYGYCGDYMVSAEKIPDMRALTEALHGIGMRVMLWYSVSFLGDFAKITPRLKDKSLYHSDGSSCYVLDPRYAEVRRHIIKSCKKAVELWNFDGLKLDFIDAFALANSEVPAGTDCETLEEGIKKLSESLSKELKSINPDVLIEFRQGYVGPVMRSLCNMIRVGDCPGSILINRTGIIDLRLTSGNTAVHSDPLTWSKTATAEEIGRCFANVIFSVAQISVAPTEMNAEQKAVTAYYTAFMKQYKKVLLESGFGFKGALFNYTEAFAYDDSVKITGLYAGETVRLEKPTEIILNGTEESFVVPDCLTEYFYETYDACGRKQSEGSVNHIEKIAVPTGGTATFLRKR